MPAVLALDVGTRRTGVAIFDHRTEMVMPKDTINHQTAEELITAVENIARSTGATTIVVGIPYLLDGSEGAQAAIAKDIAARLVKDGFLCPFIDERYTTTRNAPSDPNAEAACAILEMYIKRLGHN